MKLLRVGASSVVLLAACASATPSGITVPLTKIKRSEAILARQVPAETYRARAAFLHSRTSSGPSTVPLTNQAAFYTTNVKIGSPATSYSLFIDTGSPLTFCGVGRQYDRTPTSVRTGQYVNATYGSGSFIGLEYLDQVTVAPNLVIANQSISIPISSVGFNYTGLDGIIGLSPANLTKGVLPLDMNATIPTVMDSLASQQLIGKKIYSVYFTPSTNVSDHDPPAMTYGGVDPSLFEGELMYAPVTTTKPSAYYWGVNITTCTHGNNTIIPHSTAGIIDSGTSQFLFAQDFFDSYMKAIPAATYNSDLGLIEIPPESIKYMQPLNFEIYNRVFTADVAAQLIPQSENAEWGGDSWKRYVAVGKMERPSGRGMDFFLGLQFMQRFYVVFDADENRIGLAHTKNTLSPWP